MKTLAVLLSAVALSGCATWSTSSVEKAPTPIAVAAAPTPMDKIRISDADLVDHKYVSLGDITVTVNKTTLFHPDPTQEMVNAKLREKASELGADAVIFVRYGNGGISLMSWGSLEGKGRAIKLTQ